jgi:hypothetical protein
MEEPPMTTKPIGATLSRRILITCLAVLAALGAAALFVPQRAEAFYNPSIVLSGHQGWVYTAQREVCTLSYPPTCRAQPTIAYRWNGAAWARVPLAPRTQVYAYPYGGGWHWIWTRQTGWLAAPTRDLDTGVRPCYGPTCAQY